MTPHDPPFANGPAGEDEARQPRHLLFHPSRSDVIYSTLEGSEPGVCVWSWDTEKGTLKPIQNIVTKPKDFEGKLTTATLRMAPDAKFLFVSVRNRDGHSCLVSFRVDSESGQLTLTGRTPCETVPRTFCLDQTGKYAFAAGQFDRKLGVYAIDQATGELSKVEQHEVGKGPMWIEAR